MCAERELSRQQALELERGPLRGKTSFQIDVGEFFIVVTGGYRGSRVDAMVDVALSSVEIGLDPAGLAQKSHESEFSAA